MVLRRGRSLAECNKSERTIGEVIELMAGGTELKSLLTGAETSIGRSYESPAPPRRRVVDRRGSASQDRGSQREARCAHSGACDPFNKIVDALTSRAGWRGRRTA